MNEMKMFCYQCQETAKGSGCMLKGVCGKLPQTSLNMDLLLAVVRGIGTLGYTLSVNGIKPDTKYGKYICDAMFSTITNANFDDKSILERVDRGIVLRDELLQMAHDNGISVADIPELKWNGAKDTYNAMGMSMGVLRIANEDIRDRKSVV